MIRHLASAAIAASVAVSPNVLPAQEAEILEFLQEAGAFSDKDLNKIRKGEAVARVVKTGDNREVFVIAAVQIKATPEFVAERLTRVDRLLASVKSTQAVGMLGSPPGGSHVAALELPEDDIKALEKCKVEDCDVKLPAYAIDSLHAGIDWSSEQATGQANQFFRAAMVRYVAGYQSEGDAALGTYDDKKEPLSVAEGFDRMLSDSPYFPKNAPAIHAHVSGYPDSRSDEVQDVFYWLIADFGLKPVTSVRHMSISRSTGSAFSDVAVLVKTIYSSHYFQAGVQAIHLKEISGASGQPGTIAVLMGRERFDAKVGGLKRHMLEGKVKDNASDLLRHAKERVDTDYAAGGGN